MQNDPRLAGALAAPKTTFGDFGRYAVAPIHTRFAEVQWFVWDGETVDPKGFAAVIRQEATREAAVAGL